MKSSRLGFNLSALLLSAAFLGGLSAGEARLGELPAQWSFVQMCDTQLGIGGYVHDVAMFEMAVEQINASRPDFVLICGDLVNKANGKSWADFKRIKGALTIPCHCAAGNHDVENTPTAGSLRSYREHIGPDYYTVEHRGFTFVVTNSQLWKAPLDGESPKHDAWFRRALAAASAKRRPIVIVTHYPLFLKTPGEPENYYNLAPAKRAEILKLCKESGVVAYLSGHRHRFLDNTHEGIQFVSGETTSWNFDNRPMGYRWWDVDARGAMRHRFVPLEGATSWEAAQARRRTRARRRR